MDKPTFEALETHYIQLSSDKNFISNLYALRALAFELLLNSDHGESNNQSVASRETSKALTDYRANLSRQKKSSDVPTSLRLVELPEPARIADFRCNCIIVGEDKKGCCQTNEPKHQYSYDAHVYEITKERHSVRAASRLSLNVLRFERDLCELNRL